MIGMFTAAQNRERLQAIDRALERSNLRDDERGELEAAQRELQQWFVDLWRIEGGGAQ